MFKPNLKQFTLILAILVLAGCAPADPAASPRPKPTATAISKVETPVSPSTPNTATPYPKETPSPKPTAPHDTPTPPPTSTPAPPPTGTSPPNNEAQATGSTNNAGGGGNADVLFVKATQGPGGAWSFSVTMAHPDTGWEDYADGWDVVLPDGTVLKANANDPFTRLLLHPHEMEQPFTRSQGNLVIPAGITLLTIRAHDLVDGWGGEEIVVDLTQASGPGFEVVR